MTKIRRQSRNKRIARGLLFAVIAFALILAVVPVSAFQGEGPLHREQELQFNRTYEIFIGNAGVFIDDSKMRGTMVLDAQEWDRVQSWHQFTQRIIDIQMFEQNGDPFEWVYGNVRIYFNLDKFQYDKWIDEEANMSIWYFDKLVGGWRKCTTHWEPAAGLAKGRLWCLVRYYTRYGLAWTQPTLLMKMIKLGTVTITPTGSPSPSPSPTS